MCTRHGESAWAFAWGPTSRVQGLQTGGAEVSQGDGLHRSRPCLLPSRARELRVASPDPHALDSHVRCAHADAPNTHAHPWRNTHRYFYLAIVALGASLMACTYTRQLPTVKVSSGLALRAPSAGARARWYRLKWDRRGHGCGKPAPHLLRRLHACACRWPSGGASSRAAPVWPRWRTARCCPTRGCRTWGRCSRSGGTRWGRGGGGGRAGAARWTLRREDAALIPIVSGGLKHLTYTNPTDA